MNWPQLAFTFGGSLLLLGALALWEWRRRRALRAYFVESTRQRWEIVQSMPPGEAKDRLAALHGRLAEVSEPLWADLWRRP